MNRFLQLFMVALSALTTFQGCTKTGNLHRETTEAGTPACPDCRNYNGLQLGGLNAAVARQLARDYQTINQPLLQLEDGAQDAASIWLSLETLKAYIAKIEAATCSNNCQEKLNLGIRFYYGRYPAAKGMASPDLGNLPASYAEHHTMFMVPTFQDMSNASVQWDFDPWHWGNTSCRPVTMQEWFRQSDKPFGAEKSLILSGSEMQLFRNGSGWVPAQNHGSLIPPETNTGPAY